MVESSIIQQTIAPTSHRRSVWASVARAPAQAMSHHYSFHSVPQDFVLGLWIHKALSKKSVTQRYSALLSVIQG